MARDAVSAFGGEVALPVTSPDRRLVRSAQSMPNAEIATYAVANVKSVGRLLRCVQNRLYAQEQTSISRPTECAPSQHRFNESEVLCLLSFEIPI